MTQAPNIKYKYCIKVMLRDYWVMQDAFLLPTHMVAMFFEFFCFFKITVFLQHNLGIIYMINVYVEKNQCLIKNL